MNRHLLTGLKRRMTARNRKSEMTEMHKCAFHILCVISGMLVIGMLLRELLPAVFGHLNTPAWTMVFALNSVVFAGILVRAYLVKERRK